MFNCQNCNPTREAQSKYQIDGYTIYECSQCSHQFVDLDTNADHLEQVYGDDYFEGGKAGYPDYLKEQSMLIKRGKYYGELVNNYTTPGKILDIGAAAGFLLKGYTEMGWEGVGVEPNAKMTAYGREQLQLNMVTTGLEGFETQEKFDLISLIQVIPHLYDLNKGLEKLDELTAPGGFWLIETWNKDSKTARFFGKNWHEYSPPSVLHWFSPSTIEFFAKNYNMVKVAQGKPSKKISVGHAKSLLSYKLQDKAIGKPILALANILPSSWEIPYPAEDLFWILLQKQ